MLLDGLRRELATRIEQLLARLQFPSTSGRQEGGDGVGGLGLKSPGVHTYTHTQLLDRHISGDDYMYVYTCIG